MTVNFPNSPTNNQIFIDPATGNRYVYDAVRGFWRTSSNLTVTIANAAYAQSNAAYNIANITIVTANAAFDKANAANVLAFNTGIGANSYAGSMSNSSNNFAGTLANNSNGFTSTVFANANGTHTFAIAAYGRANSSAQLAFKTVAVSGNNIVAASNTDTLTIGNSNGIVVLSNTVNNSLQITQNPSGVTAATYGSATAVPAIVVDTFGKITSASNVSISGGFSTMTIFTGSTTWTIPAGVTKLKATVIGGGGGGSTSNGVGNSGGSSSIQSGTQTIATVTSTGGEGGAGGGYSSMGRSGTGSGGDINVYGGYGSYYGAGAGAFIASGGLLLSPYGALSGLSYGSGGSGGGSAISTPAPGGGGGGGSIKYLTNLTPGLNISITIGSGGTGGSAYGGFAGGTGASGVVIFEY